MKKKTAIVGLLLILLLIISVTLCACRKNESNGNNNTTTDNWEEVKLSPMEIYTKFLGGFTSIANEFSTNKLSRDTDKVSLDSKMKVEINNNDFWATLKLNYDNGNKANAMAAFEIDTKEDSYEDMVFGAFVYNEELYLAFGSTKFKLEMKAETWADIFPFKMDSNMSLDKAAAAMGVIMKNKQGDDNLPKVKTRQNGMEEQYNIVLNIDVAKSVSTLITQYIDTDKIDKDTSTAIEEILRSVFGLTTQDVKDGKFPKSSLKIDFTTSNLKLSEMKIKLEIDGDSKSTLLDGDDIEIEIELDKFEISKSNTSIPFVNNQSERNKYLSFLDNSFRYVSDNVTEINGVKKEYEMSITAKIFQEPRNENYAFMEYKNKSTGKIEVAGCIYHDVAYLYKEVDGNLVCTTSLPLDISTVAEKVVSNDFSPKTEPNALNIIGYVIGAIRIGDDDVSFVIDEDLFNVAWYNFHDAIAFVNAAIEGDIFEDDDVNYFTDFVTKKDWIINLSYDHPFLTMITDDAQLQASIARTTTLAPAREFTAAMSSGD